MSKNGYLKVAAVIGAVAMLPLAACSSDDQKASSGNPVTRAATGDLTTTGGARRLDGDQSQTIRDAINSSGAKNVILLIGDGMGDSEITIARNYEKGAGGFFSGLDALPLTGQYTTYALRKDGKPNYVTDSAASATAWTTGTKTYNGALGIDIKGAPQKTILELAKDQGFATGDITTSEIQDATPASLFSHITERDCYGPKETAEDCTKEALENGGPGSVTEQLLATKPDITMGGGAETFAQTAAGGDYKGKTLEVQAKERGFQIVRTASELNAITKADQDAPLLGLFDDGNMPVRSTGPAAVRQGYLQPAGTCTANPERGAEVPELAAMTQKSIDLLSASDKGKNKGFFLQVESASIDKRDHAADPCGQIGETVVFDEAVQKALEFAKKDGNTLVIATADHGHSSQIAEPYTEEDLRDIAEDTKQPIERVRDVMYPGLTRLLTTADGADMLVSYGTSADVGIEDQGHTGTQLRIAAYGPQAANVVALTDQSDLFFTMTDALGIKR
ncbi:alkaline phosphatase [Mycolicibacterium sp. P9-64]|uniref:alkaline phosphatase n=1 Tax=Mycolicibacterium sp. P9-64 TaxID=2024612 RepID=UPI0011EE119B|nr:alkaline phosphatase [Mycolicibacterium sp. P9-64]KAA0081059.1 alkaline phosphatase [Mycolicibacterium sp. P9-64]